MSTDDSRRLTHARVTMQNFVGAIFSRSIVLLGATGTLGLTAWGIYVVTDSIVAANFLLLVLCCTIAASGCVSRIELRSDLLCIVNIATVSYVRRSDITHVLARPALRVETQDTAYCSTLYSASLSARLTNYRASDTAAGFINEWRARRSPARLSTHESAKRPRWELALYFAFFVLLFGCIHLAS